MALLYTVMALLAHAANGQSTPAGGDSVTVLSFKPPTFSDNTFAYVYGQNHRNPFIASAEQPGGADITRNALEFKHVDAWQYGHNLAYVFIKSSSETEPAAGGGSGALGFYSIFRSGVSINRVAGRPIIALGPLHDIDIQAGLNLQTKNTALAPNERTLYFGPNLQFVFGSGFLNIGLHLRQEWNRNGILGKNEHYQAGFNIAPVWNFPFRVGRAQFVFEGYADYNTPKGKDASGQATHAEFIARPQLKLDISPVIGLSSHLLELGVGAEYWHNMFGKDADKVPGAKQFTPVVSLNVHWSSKGFGH